MLLTRECTRNAYYEQCLSVPALVENNTFNSNHAVGGAGGAVFLDTPSAIITCADGLSIAYNGEICARVREG